MAEARLQLLAVGAAERRIAYLRQPAARHGAPGVLWLCGFKSAMTSTKADALAGWARRRGIGCLRFDYSGHGQSPGAFEDGTIGRWLEEARAAFCRLSSGPQIVVGSSMGGYLALLLLRDLLARAPHQAQRLRGLVLVAPAWDMTELLWRGMSPEARAEMASEGVYQRPSRYGDGPYAITRALIADGRRHLLWRTPFDPGRPVHILHGRADAEVPFAHSRALLRRLAGARTRLIAVAGGDHRLSRPQDLALLRATVGGLIGV
jgi:alpha-beta hydrolase superfamily lysophospholipase